MSFSSLDSLPKLNRRQSLQLGAATTAAGLMASQKLAAPAHAKDPIPPATTPFMVPLPVYPAKEVAPGRFSPTPGEYYVAGEAGRAPHQRWETFHHRSSTP